MMITGMRYLILSLFLLFPESEAFSPLQSPHTSTRLASTTSPSPETTDKGLLKRDRYIATNRFAVRRDKGPKFEQRWANRKSRLAELPGFRYFHLMRRVTLDGKYDGGETDEEAQENYVSFTIWDKKSDFSAWRKGDAFKEAHGGTSIGAFLSTMVNSALVLRGPPRPAFYDGLYVSSTKSDSVPETVDGWRSVVADGMNPLPTECFVCMQKYYIPPSKAVEFEGSAFWTKQDANDIAGLVAFGLMRRDGQAKGHGTVEMDESEPTYVATYVFENKASFDEWAAAAQEAPATPEQVYYEGTLVLSSTVGA